MSLNFNLFTVSDRVTDPARASPSVAGTISCPGCRGDVAPLDTPNGWQTCPFCEKRLQIRLWPAIRRNSSAATALPDQATCFFHPEKAFQACCQRCGRFVCALCDLQLGAEHVCPTCFERGRGNSRQSADAAEWRHRDVLYDSIALAVGWAWIIFWPTMVVALPVAIFLHVKYRKAPRSYLVPRAGWRFWVAYAGFAWLPLLLATVFLMARLTRGRF